MPDTTQTHTLLSECPFSDVACVCRNQTERSRYAHEAIRQFLATGARAAVVNSDGWEVQTLYKGLTNACRNRAYRGRVKAMKHDGALVLVRQISI